MNNSSDNENDVTLECPASADSDQGPDANRRRFARNAVVGSAVLATLGNRAAWGQTECNNDPCLSANAWASYQTNGWTSYIGGTDEQLCKLDKAAVIDAADFVDESTGKVCPGYNEPDILFEVPDNTIQTRAELIRRWNESP